MPSLPRRPSFVALRSIPKFGWTGVVLYLRGCRQLANPEKLEDRERPDLNEFGAAVTPTASQAPVASTMAASAKSAIWFTLEELVSPLQLAAHSSSSCCSGGGGGESGSGAKSIDLGEPSDGGSRPLSSGSRAATQEAFLMLINLSSGGNPTKSGASQAAEESGSGLSESKRQRLCGGECQSHLTLRTLHCALPNPLSRSLFSPLLFFCSYFGVVEISFAHSKCFCVCLLVFLPLWLCCIPL